PVPIWNRFQYNRYLPGPKCNADFGASFRCLSQLKTVARQIPRGTCKTAPAPNVNFVLCRSRSLVFSQQQSYDSEEQASTNRASHQPFNRENTERKTVKSVAVFRTKRFKHRDLQQMQQNNCVKRGERRQESTANQQPKTEKYTEMTAKLPTVVS